VTALVIVRGDGMRRHNLTRLSMLLVLCLLLLSQAPRIRTTYLTVLLLAEAASPDIDGPIATLRSDPHVEHVSFPVEGKTVVADLYRPADGGPHPGIVLCHGVADRGKDDLRLVNFADALARAGYMALVPDFENLRQFRVRPSDVDEIVGAFEHLSTLPSVKRDRIGLFGFSYAGGLSILAARDPRISDRVKFCFLLGAYYDLEAVVGYMTTGMYRLDDAWTYLEPRNSGRWAFLQNSVDLIENDRDRALLSGIARARLDDPQSDVSHLARSLGEEGAAVYALLVNEDPEQVGVIIDGLNERVRTYFDELSPRGKMDNITARLILAHGRDDNLIPYTESIMLAEHAPPEAPVHLELLDSFEHMDIRFDAAGGPGGFFASLREVRRLFSVTYDLLSQGLL
jgi:dienelactone hydrolase